MSIMRGKGSILRYGVVALSFVNAIVSCRNGLASDGQQPISFAVGSAYSPTSYGGDHNGAYFWKAGGYAHIARQWAVAFSVMHVRYTDYPGVGRAYFTPIAIGVRFTPVALRVRPFLEVLGVAAPARWADAERLVDGIQVGAGLDARIVDHVGLEATIHRLRTGGSEVLGFDAGPTELRGLNQVLIGASVTLGM